MKVLCFILPIFLLSLMFVAKGEKTRRSNEGERVPKIDVVKAIKLVMEHHKKNSAELGEIFVDEAVWVRADSYWKIGARVKARETGHIYYKVYSTGKVEVGAAVKDG